MLTAKRFEELHALGYKTLTALTHRQMRDLLQRRVVQLELFNEQAEAMDGCYIIRKEAPAPGVSGARDCYKDLIHVEQAFGNLKTVWVEMRPFYHHRDDRLPAHVFVCMLAYQHYSASGDPGFPLGRMAAALRT